VHVRRSFIADSPPAFADVVDAAADQLRRWEPELTAAALPGLEALLVLGEFTAVRRLLDNASGDPRVETIVLGRYVAWSGDLRAADARRHTIRSAVQGAATDAAMLRTASDSPLLDAAACAAAERLARDLAHPQLAAAARASVRNHLRQLALEPDADAELLTHALGVGQEGRVTPAPAEADVAYPGDAVHRLLHLAHRVLGLEPDAPRHRLRLQPPAWPLRIREIPFGDGSVSLAVGSTAHGRDATISFSLEQESGAIPVTALLEPRLIAGFSTAEVDGMPADLAPRRLPGGGTQLPVQLVLDAPRTLVVHMQEGRSPE
jgi:hypothetical protein